MAEGAEHSIPADHVWKTIKKNRNRVEETLKKHERLPEDIFALVTTTRNKEGINIADTSVSWYMYTESHYNDEFVQMWGRIRENLEEFSIIYDAKQHPLKNCYDGISYLLSKFGIECATKTLQAWCDSNKHMYNFMDLKHEEWTYSLLESTLKNIEKAFPYLCYDVFKRQFVRYRGRIVGDNLFTRSVCSFDDYINFIFGYVNSQYNPFPLPVRIDESVNQLFEGNEVIVASLKNKIQEYFTEKGFVDTYAMSQTDIDEALQYIYALGVKTPEGKSYGRLTSALKRVGFKMERQHKKDGKAKITKIS